LLALTLTGLLVVDQQRKRQAARVALEQQRAAEQQARYAAELAAQAAEQQAIRAAKQQQEAAELAEQQAARQRKLAAEAQAREARLQAEREAFAIQQAAQQAARQAEREAERQAAALRAARQAEAAAAAAKAAAQAQAALAARTQIQHRRITDADIALVANRFRELEQAIEARDTTRVGNIVSAAADSDDRKLSYLDYVLTNFETLDVALTNIQAHRQDQSVRATLTLRRMTRANGDIVIPPAKYRTFPLHSVRDEDWSTIYWK